jgi:hypothetical protein
MVNRILVEKHLYNRKIKTYSKSNLQIEYAINYIIKSEKFKDEILNCRTNRDERLKLLIRYILNKYPDDAKYIIGTKDRIEILYQSDINKVYIQILKLKSKETSKLKLWLIGIACSLVVIILLAIVFHIVLYRPVTIWNGFLLTMNLYNLFSTYKLFRKFLNQYLKQNKN